MSLQVDAPRAEVGKGLAADGTGVRLLSSVEELVEGEKSLEVEAPPTVVTGIGQHFGVVPLVELQVVAHPESSEAVGNETGEGLVGT